MAWNSNSRISPPLQFQHCEQWTVRTRHTCAAVERVGHLATSECEQEWSVKPSVIWALWDCRGHVEHDAMGGDWRLRALRSPCERARREGDSMPCNWHSDKGAAPEFRVSVPWLSAPYWYRSTGIVQTYTNASGSSIPLHRRYSRRRRHKWAQMRCVLDTLAEVCSWNWTNVRAQSLSVNHYQRRCSARERRALCQVNARLRSDRRRTGAAVTEFCNSSLRRAHANMSAFNLIALRN